MATLEVKRIPIEDYDKISQLFAEFSEQNLRPEFYWPTEKVESELKVCHAHGLFLQATLVAVVLWRSWVDQNEITCVLTSPSHRSKGLALQLLSQLFKLSSGETRRAEWVLEVHEQNKSAIGLYNKLEFKQVSTRKNYYRDGGKALILVRKSK